MTPIFFGCSVNAMTKFGQGLMSKMKRKRGFEKIACEVTDLTETDQRGDFYLQYLHIFFMF